MLKSIIRKIAEAAGLTVVDDPISFDELLQMDEHGRKKKPKRDLPVPKKQKRDDRLLAEQLIKAYDARIAYIRSRPQSALYISNDEWSQEKIRYAQSVQSHIEMLYDAGMLDELAAFLADQDL